ncbi:hypothetical protein NE237_027560 [Protea cynaroides]|uniref:Generative cell specific-1/HAP2 domain-containing protein n=1 Tax=Protea cynaroides TaxID=273540 RepID=A0A9Q0GN81_9MAGN|nr:hypothetical protein NE237_027560 [Protea cynaroides]
MRFTLDGLECNKIGVSYEAYNGQPNFCSLTFWSCLHNQCVTIGNQGSTDHLQIFQTLQEDLLDHLFLYNLLPLLLYIITLEMFKDCKTFMEASTFPTCQRHLDQENLQ